MHRRRLLASTAALLASPAVAASIRGRLPWRPNAGEPPTPVSPVGLEYLTPEEADILGALVDRLIPPDANTPGGLDIGCVTYIDRQLAGPYGSSAGLYMRPPFIDGSPTQGDQSPLTPAQRYRQGLAALALHVRQGFGGQRVSQLSVDQLNQLLTGLERGTVQLSGASGRAFFDLLLKNTKEGFFADPVYGGNRDMAAWRMIGFPGARYDHRDWITRHNERYPLPPVGIEGRPDWAAPR